MEIARIAIVVLQISIFLAVCSLGMHAQPSDVTQLFRRPSLLVRSLLATNIVMPLLAVLMAAAFNLTPAVKVALILVSLSPVPPLLHQQQLKLGARQSYVDGLLMLEAALAVILVPLSIAFIAWMFGRNVALSPSVVAKVAVMTILLPLALGMLIRRFAIQHAQRISAPLAMLAILLVLISSIVLVVAVFPYLIRALGNCTLPAMCAFVIVGLAVGHWLGGPESGDRSALALATAARHPGLAIAIAVASFPAQRRSIAAAILLYLLARTVVMLPYFAWRKRNLAAKLGRSEVQQERAA